jgi:crossover junction endodeoxyribonuclease RuvC
MLTSIGLDLSLVKTGVVVIKNSNVILKQLIQSKPSGDKPINELKRLEKIVEEIEKIVEETQPNVAVIENLAFMARNTTALTQLAGLNYFVRAMLSKRNIPFFLCAPTSLKKFATGKGNCEKDHIILEAYKQFGEDNIDNNIADALFLAKIGCIILDDKVNTTVYQKDVIDLLKKQG